LCKTFEADLGIKPKILDIWDSKNEPQSLSTYYNCTFEEDDRQLIVDSTYGRSVALRFKDDFHKLKDKKVETQIHKLRAADIRPY
jgi:hypothetical protein